MKRTTLIIIAIVASFGFGFAFKTVITNKTDDTKSIKKVTGIGGIFFKCKNPNKLKEWYKTHLGFVTDDYGATFGWWQSPDSTKRGYTQWTPFTKTTTYFGPSSQDFMINYRVENLVALVEVLKEEGVTIADKIETYDYGKFVHIVDIEGNRVELWEPNETLNTIK